MRILCLLITFYRNFFWFSFIILCLSAWIFVDEGLLIITPVVWLKVITSTITYFFVNNSMRKEYFYYRNLGLSKKKIWISIFLFEVVVTILTLVIVYKLS